MIIGISWSVQAQEGAAITPESTELYVDLEQVRPGLTPQEAPSDAIVLFDGTDLARITNSYLIYFWKPIVLTLKFRIINWN